MDPTIDPIKGIPNKEDPLEEPLDPKFEPRCVQQALLLQQVVGPRRALHLQKV